MGVTNINIVEPLSVTIKHHRKSDNIEITVGIYWYCIMSVDACLYFTLIILNRINAKEI